MLLHVFLFCGCADHRVNKSSAAAASDRSDCPDAKPLDDIHGWDLGTGKYHAEQIHDAVFVFAKGSTPTPGYDVRIAQQKITIFPPQFSLYWKAPSDVRPAVLTPYVRCVKFRSQEKVTAVVVQDRDGKHNVNVDQVHD